MTAAVDLKRVAEFRLSFARRQAAQLTEVPGGIAVRDSRFAASHEHNQLIFYRSPGQAELSALAERYLGDLPYRRITLFDDPAWAASVPTISADGYWHATELIMTREGGAVTGGSPPARAPAPAPAEPATLAELRPAVLAELRNWMPGVQDAVIEQLTDRRHAWLRGADRVLFLAARAGDGAIASWAALYAEPALGVAQVEDVVTGGDYLRQGYADRVLTSALRHAAGCDLVFLLADPKSWPSAWYRRRGFRPAGQSHVFTRVTAPG